ncbi:MAG: SurA N-terminal domain-containing protein [Nitrospirae bacterium]|nr:SurA N-terminal domain-containing protein [Nitrospirota bacterium]
MRLRADIFFNIAMTASFILFLQISSVLADTEIIERVVAIVNDEVILLSEFNNAYENAIASGRGISKEEFLDEMVNTELILEQAKKFSFEISPDTKVSDNLLVERYLERRIKAFIHIPFEAVEDYYIKNSSLFKGKNFYDVQDQVEALLVDEKLNIRISEHIKELRDNAYIRVQPGDDHKTAD